MKYLIPFLVLIFLLSGCLFQESSSPTGQPHEQESTEVSEYITLKEIRDGIQDFNGQLVQVKGKVKEVRDAGTYTYMLLDDGTDQIWLATSKINVSVGEEIVVPEAQVQTGFKSKTFDKTFDILLLASVIQGKDVEETHGAVEKSVQKYNFSGIEKAKGGYTIKEIYENSEELSGKEVKVSGLVIKVSEVILGQKWIHLQDGTGDPKGENFDLTLTYTGNRSFSEGEEVVVEGKLETDFDLGSGYYYPVIIPNATITAN